MNYAIVTVAGMATRFNEGMQEAGLKCIYYEKDPRHTLLYNILKKCGQFDQVIVVGGYQYEELTQYIETYRSEFPCAVQVIYNPEYKRFGTGYTLKLGLEACCRDESCASVTLIEGDLYFDQESLDRVCHSKKDTITVNRELIYSNQAVIAYVNEKDHVKYIYSTSHGMLSINEAFQAIFHSGQIWKFGNMEHVGTTYASMTPAQWQGTNLVYVNQYMSQISWNDIEIVTLKEWKNCNTVESYRACMWER